MNFDITRFDIRTLSEAGVAMPISHRRSDALSRWQAGQGQGSIAVYDFADGTQFLRVCSFPNGDVEANSGQHVDPDFEAEPAVVLGGDYDPARVRGSNGGPGRGPRCRQET